MADTTGLADNPECNLNTVQPQADIARKVDAGFVVL
jgi:hypothetical protein